jgi:hypothetical protein
MEKGFAAVSLACVVLLLMFGFALAADAGIGNASTNETPASQASLNETAPQPSCASTAECASGYCLNGTCSLPEVSNFVKGGACNATRDCGEGFCTNRTCITPLASVAVFEFGAKPPCSPIVECTPGSFCLMACDLLWLVLIALSLAAGYVSRMEKNKLTPAVLFVLPFLLGLFIYPVVGILVASVEIVIFFSKKKEVPLAAGEEAMEVPAAEQPGEAQPSAGKGMTDLEEPPPLQM